MATIWTLLCNSVEKSLADWGVCDDFFKEKDNKGRGTVQLRTIEAFDPGVTQWLVNQALTIYRDRTSVGTGGSLWFQGYFDDPERQNHGGGQHVTYKAHNV